MLTQTPRSASAACNSFSVVSGLAVTRSRMNAACASIRPDKRSPPCLSGVTSPVSRKRVHQRITLETPTLKRRAA